MKKKNKDETERFVERKFLIVLPCRWPLQVQYFCNLSNLSNLSSHLHIYVWPVTDSHDSSTFVFLCALSFHKIIIERERDLSPFLCI